jgi:hypothetical protein
MKHLKLLPLASLLGGCYYIEKDDARELIKISYKLGCTDNSTLTEKECSDKAVLFSDKAMKVIEELNR